MAEPNIEKKLDRELEEFRNIMQPPTTFEEGFNWSSFLGALFVGLLMVPGAVYMGLMAGTGLGDSARWVTVILFIEVARRAQRNLKKAEIFVLFYLVGAAMAMPFGGLHWNQFFARSEAASVFGIAQDLPRWFAPPPESDSYAKRSFLHWDWLPVIGMMVLTTFVGLINNMILGYGFFKISSDIEKLPFPMAPVGAAGTVALAEDMDEKNAGNEEKSWRWRIFSIGGAIGLAFGCIYLLLPVVSGALTGTPISIIQIPFVDWSPKTAKILPAVATGIDLNLWHLLFGMVMPFYSIMGTVIGLASTYLLNPILYKFQILQSWVAGDSTPVTIFKNNIDFYFSFGIGISLAVALVGLANVFRSLLSRKKTIATATSGLDPEYLKSRGDVPNWAIVLTYFGVTMLYILLSGWLIDWHKGVMIVLVFFGFIYFPFISYVSARMQGMVGMSVTIPYIHQASLILSGYQGVKVWFLPIPASSYGNDVVFYRQCELTGTKFKSIWKAQVFLTPLILVSSILYMSYIWGLAEIPSAAYPFAQTMWELDAANQCIMYTSTTGEFSIFDQAFRWSYLLIGMGVGLGLFGLLQSLSAPIFLSYGIIQGLGQIWPHGIILQLVGALIGRFVFYKHLGQRWRQYVMVLFAGFTCGMGLIATLGVGVTFLSKAIIKMPF